MLNVGNYGPKWDLPRNLLHHHHVRHNSNTHIEPQVALQVLTPALEDAATLETEANVITIVVVAEEGMVTSTEAAVIVVIVTVTHDPGNLLHIHRIVHEAQQQVTTIDQNTLILHRKKGLLKGTEEEHHRRVQMEGHGRAATPARGDQEAIAMMTTHRNMHREVAAVGTIVEAASGNGSI